jgi:hypothetical protein
MLTFLVTGTAYSEQLPSKPFKVCPEVVRAKDTPCRVLGPTTAIVQRIEIPNEDKKKIAELEQENANLRKLVEELKNLIEKQKQ